LEKCLGKPICALDFSDDRLAVILDCLGQDDKYEEYKIASQQAVFFTLVIVKWPRLRHVLTLQKVVIIIYARFPQSLTLLGRGRTPEQIVPSPNRIVPHPRTLRKAREQVNQMVKDEVFPRKITRYLHCWCTWWVRITENWEYQELLVWFLSACWMPNPAAAFAAGLLQRAMTKQRRNNPASEYSVQGNHLLLESIPAAL
jgi:hypothetical protein